MNKKYILSLHEKKIMWVYESHSVTFGRKTTEAGNNDASLHEMIQIPTIRDLGRIVR